MAQLPPVEAKQGTIAIITGVAVSWQTPRGCSQLLHRFEEFELLKLNVFTLEFFHHLHNPLFDDGSGSSKERSRHGSLPTEKKQGNQTSPSLCFDLIGFLQLA
eukprot:752773-Hanusia_phi.AAC.1